MELLPFAGNIGLAVVLGIVIGLERQWRQHPAGLRTNALVAIGAALFVSISRMVPNDSSPTRIASYIAGGIGFLAGGVILKEHANVRGITTAATVWCSAAVGTLVGLGFAWYAVIGAVAILFVVGALRPVSHGFDEWRVRSGKLATDYRLRLSCHAKDHAIVHAALTRELATHPTLRLAGISAQKKKHSRLVIIAAVGAHSGDDATIQAVIERLLAEPAVTAANWEKLPPMTE